MPSHRLLSSPKLKISEEGKIVNAEPLLKDLQVWFHQRALLISEVVEPGHQSSDGSWTQFWVHRLAYGQQHWLIPATRFLQEFLFWVPQAPTQCLQ